MLVDHPCFGRHVGKGKILETTRGKKIQTRVEGKAADARELPFLEQRRNQMSRPEVGIIKCNIFSKSKMARKRCVHVLCTSKEEKCHQLRNDTVLSINMSCNEPINFRVIQM